MQAEALDSIYVLKMPHSCLGWAVARREGVEEIPADAWYTDVWKQEQTTAAS